MGKHKKIINREIKIAVILFSVLLAINLLPDFFALNRPSDFYQKYYTGVLPISFTQLILGIFVLRWIILTIMFIFKGRA